MPAARLTIAELTDASIIFDMSEIFSAYATGSEIMYFTDALTTAIFLSPVITYPLFRRVVIFPEV